VRLILEFVRSWCWRSVEGLKRVLADRLEDTRRRGLVCEWKKGRKGRRTDEQTRPFEASVADRWREHGNAYQEVFRALIATS